jgi:hypothetical protein
MKIQTENFLYIAVFVDVYMFYNLLLSLHTTSIPVTGMEDLECKTWEIMSVRNTIFVRLELISLRLGFRRNFLYLIIHNFPS